MKDIPCRPRARITVPAIFKEADRVLKVIRLSNPTLPTHNWKVAKLENPKGPYKGAIINAESLSPLAQSKGVIRFGFDEIPLRVYKKDGAEAQILPPSPPIQAETAAEEPGASLTFPSLEDNASLVSPAAVETPTTDQGFSAMEAEVNDSEDEDILLESTSDIDDSDITVLDADREYGSENAAVTPH